MLLTNKTIKSNHIQHHQRRTNGDSKYRRYVDLHQANMCGCFNYARSIHDYPHDYPRDYPRDYPQVPRGCGYSQLRCSCYACSTYVSCASADDGKYVIYIPFHRISFDNIL